MKNNLFFSLIHNIDISLLLLHQFLDNLYLRLNYPYFLCLFFHLIMFFAQSSFRSRAHFLLGIFFFLLLGFESTLYIPDMSFIRYVFCRSIAFLFVLSTVSLEKAGFNFHKVQYISILWFALFVPNLSNHCLILDHKIFCVFF